MQAKTIVMLAGRGESTNIIYNALRDDFKIGKVIIEKPVPRPQFLKRRVKRLGFLKVAGQVAFKMLVIPQLKENSRQRILKLKQTFELDDAPISESEIIKVISVNSEEVITILREITPDIVIINGTRIVSNRTLSALPVKFINMHAGITPLYRGVHGAYWALVEGDSQACGVTVHFVDSGIDTGNIIQQGFINPTEEDNFVTYPLLQLAAGIPLLKKAIDNVFENRVKIKANPRGKSKLWSHPTLFEYIWHRLRYGVK